MLMIMCISMLFILRCAAGETGRVELLAMLGLFGTLISAVQVALVERHALVHAAWSWQVSALTVCCALPCNAALPCMREEDGVARRGLTDSALMDC